MLGNLLTILYQLTKTQVPSLNTFLDILLTRFHANFLKGHNPRKGDNSEKKKYGSANFSWGIYVWNFKTLTCTVHKIWHASKSVSDAQTDNPRAICHLNFFEVGGIKTIL